MKKILLALSLGTVFMACKNKTIESLDTNPAVMTAYTPMYESNYSTDKGDMAKVAEMGKVTPVAKAPVVSRNTNSGSNNNVSTTSTKSTATTTAAKKKGWSGRAKGAAVGAGSGAIIGAIANKNNRGVGALVGGLIGAASGYVIGNEVDRKKERNQ